jgi:hypothetical protein
MKTQKFTFKTEKSEGHFRSLFPDHHYIKLNKIEVGNISDDTPIKIRFMVVKDDIMEDNNPNCVWKWITLKREFISLQDAKDFLNVNIEHILTKFNLVKE